MNIIAYICPVMRTLQESYEIFCRLMTEDNLYLDRSLSFRDICHWLSADETSLNTMIEKEQGLGGQELMDAFRRRVPAFLKKKYGIQA